jgi:hypothetical protein
VNVSSGPDVVGRDDRIGGGPRPDGGLPGGLHVI